MIPVCFSQIITGRGFTTANKRIEEKQEEGKEILGKDKVCMRAKWPIRLELIPVSVA